MDWPKTLDDVRRLNEVVKLLVRYVQDKDLIKVKENVNLLSSNVAIVLTDIKEGAK